jgi:excisionase family DNA binding protein
MTSLLPAAHGVRMAYRIDEVSAALGISRSTLFELLRTGKVASVKIGGRRLVPATVLDALLKIEEPAE